MIVPLSVSVTPAGMTTLTPDAAVIVPPGATAKLPLNTYCMAELDPIGFRFSV